MYEQMNSPEIVYNVFGGHSEQGSVSQGEYEVTVDTQNRFENGGGRGSPWQNVRQHKRKKFNSSSMDTSAFHTLSTDDKLARMFENMNRNYDMLANMNSSQEKYYSATRDLQRSISDLCEQTERVEQTVDKQSHLMKVLSYRSIDTEARNRRNNLIIWGITENMRINCADLVLNFLEDELEIDTTNIVLDGAHRLGVYSDKSNGHNKGNIDPKRPIVVRFRDFSSTELVLRQAYKLKGSTFGIDRDYPRELADARKELYTSKVAREARSRKQKVKILYPAKLIVNGKMIQDKFPDWSSTLKESRLGSPHNVPLQQVTKMHQGFASKQSRSDTCTSYLEETDVHSSSSGSDRGDNEYNVFTSTQIQQDTHSSNRTNVNKHAHFLLSEESMNGVSRDSVLSDNHEVLHVHASNTDSPAARPRTTQKTTRTAAQNASIMHKAHNANNVSSKNIIVQSEYNPTCHLRSECCAETINRIGFSMSLKNMTIDYDDQSAAAPDTGQNLITKL